MKRINILLLSFIMLVTCISAPAYAASSFADVTGTKYENAANLLSALGIMIGYDSATFGPEKPVSRAEMAVIMTRFLNLGVVGKPAGMEEKFDDVPDGYWAKDYILTAADLGIINGYGDGSFYPGEPVTYEQAIKMIVCALGYGEYANIRGGYPVGYISQANELGITKGVKTQAGVWAIRGDIALMVYNALNADIMQATSFTPETGENKYTVTPGETALSKYFKVVKSKGIVNANAYSGLLSESNLSESRVRIDNTVYDAGDTDIAMKLGSYVTFWAQEQEDSDYMKIIYYTEDKSGSLDTLVIQAEDIVKSAETNYRQITYWSGNDSSSKTKVAKLSPVAIAIYNGVAAPLNENTDEDLLHVYSGRIALTDSDGDSEYDTVDILSYTTIVVGAISKTSGVIVDKYTPENTVTLNPNDTDYKCYIYTKNGSLGSLSNINVNDVIQVTQSWDQKLRIAYVNGYSITGTVSEVGSDSVIIGSETYKLPEAIKYMPKAKTVETVDPRTYIDLHVGDNGTFYIDGNGYLVGSSVKADSSMTVGLVIAGRIGTLGSNAELKIFTVYDSQTKILPLAEKVRYIDETQTSRGNVSAEEALTLLGAKNVSDVDKLIKFKTNSAGQISTVEAVLARATGGTYRAGARAFFDSAGNVLQILDGSTKVIIKQKDLNGDIRYYTTNMGYFWDNNGPRGASKWYNLSTDRSPQYADIYFANESISRNIDQMTYGGQSIKMFVQLSKMIDSDGNDTYRVYYYDGASYKNAEVHNNSNAESYLRRVESTIKKGDIIRVAFDGSKISDIYILVQRSVYEDPAGYVGTDTRKESSSGSYNYTYDLYEVVSLSQDKQILKANKLNSATPSERLLNITGSAFTKIERSGSGEPKALVQASNADLFPGQRIYVKSYITDGNVKEICILTD